MTPESLLQQRVAQLRARLQWLVAQRWAFLGLTAAGIVACLLALAAKLRWLPDAVDWIGLILVTGAVTGLAIGWTRRVTCLAAAQLADSRLDLKERLSSGLVFAAAGARDEMTAAQLADASARAREARSSQVFPWRLPRQCRAAGATLLLLLAILYVPELPFFHSPQQRA